MDKEKKLFQITHVVYEDVCGDSYYGKDFKNTSYTVYDTEQKVSIAVELLNKANMSYYGREPEDELDFYYDNQDYYCYKEVKPEISIIGLLDKLDVARRLAFNRKRRRKKT